MARYLAFHKGSNQQDAMRHFEQRWGTEMYYLFYNPINIPHSVKMPLESTPELGQNAIGCRVVRKDQLDRALESFEQEYSPSYKDLRDRLPRETLGVPSPAGWRLEDFVSDLMLKCKAGLVDDSSTYESLMILMNQKRMPMSCALSITFDIRK